jgi:hypothetical protein
MPRTKGRVNYNIPKLIEVIEEKLTFMVLHCYHSQIERNGVGIILLTSVLYYLP